jgi:hypothetical protein
MKKKNGAHATFMRGLSDCLFMVSQTDVECSELALRAQGMTDSQIALQKKLFWKKKFLRHCRRTTGHDRVCQLSRFDKFIETFIQIKDAKTKELLIGPRTKLKIESTRLAIASGYYIDPNDVNMFRELGRDKLGRMKYACYRGTNALEVIKKPQVPSTFTISYHLIVYQFHRDIIGTYEIFYGDIGVVQSLHTTL